MKSVTCEAANTVASVKASIKLNVNYKPYFLGSNEEFLLYGPDMCAKQTTLDCQTIANPQANVTWFKMLGAKKQNIGLGPTYTIPAFNCGNTFVNRTDSMNQVDDDHDFGLYLCEANNGVGTGNPVVIRTIKINSKGELYWAF